MTTYTPAQIWTEILLTSIDSMFTMWEKTCLNELLYVKSNNVDKFLSKDEIHYRRHPKVPFLNCDVTYNFL